MRTHPLVSIIMAVYNVESYLNRSVASVLAQTFRDFELLLVDDGSTDSSASVCEGLAACDYRIQILSQPHSGTSCARNTGIEAAKGDFIGFVDADDWIEPDMLALLYKNSLAYDSQISACAFIKISNEDAMQFCSDTTSPVVYTPAKALEHTFKLSHMRYSACNKLFHRSLFNRVRYPKELRYEDKATTYKLIHLSEHIVWCPSPKYHYFMRPGSTMHEGFNEHTLDLLTVNEELLRFIKTDYPTLEAIAEGSYAGECMKLVMAMKSGHHQDDAVFEHCMARIRKSILSAFRFPVADANTRIRMLAACIHSEAFRYHER